MNTFIRTHVSEYEDKPLYVVRVPGISRFLGPFADYPHGLSLYAADSRNLYLGVSLREDNQILIYNSAVKDRKHFTVNTLKFRKEDRWANYLKGVLSVLSAEGYVLSGMNFTLGGDVLSGISESVCCSVVLATCLIMQKLLAIRLEDYIFTRIVVSACIAFCGENCSVSAVKSMLAAEKGKFVLIDNNSGNVSLKDNPFGKDCPHSLLYIESGLPAAVVNDEMQRRHREIQQVFEDMDPGIGIAGLITLTEHEIREKLSGLSENAKKVCLYFLEEYKAALSAGLSASEIGKAIGRTGRALRDYLDMSFPELDWIIKRAGEDSECLGASVVINGGRGCVGLVTGKKRIDYYKSKLEDYEHIFGFGTAVSEFEPCAGAEVCRI